jgi:glycosyltransferase involved in cell wall biosynthesis
VKILFLDQTSQLGGAEFALLDVARIYRRECLVGLFEDGPFKKLLDREKIPVKILASKSIAVRKNSNFWKSLGSVRQLIPLIHNIIREADRFDLIFANTQKALVVGAIASWISRRPLVYYLHDILSLEHFSQTNIRVAINLANRFASLVIADSQATKAAFVKAGGREKITEVVYYIFRPELYLGHESEREKLRRELGISDRFVIGHFSRLSAWKGQHILIEALKYCSENAIAVFVGDALFGEKNYVDRLHQQVTELGLKERVKFLGFRSDIPELMTACDLIAHTSTAPEPFGRVIVEGMLCQRPVVAANAGGAIEIIDRDRTGWLHSPGDSRSLAKSISHCLNHPDKAKEIAKAGKIEASKRFDRTTIEQQISHLLDRVYQLYQK